MKKNNIIGIAQVISRILIFVAVIFYLLFLCITIHWHFDPSFYNEFDVAKLFSARSGIYLESLHNINPEIRLSEIGYGMMYWLVLRISIIFASYTLILRKGLKILGSIKSLKIFFSDNIKNFRQIGNYGLIIFLFTSINFFIRSSSSNFSINPHFEILLLAFGSFIISEIFAEGKLLQEEKDQII